jgi:hypothetical protein
MVRCSFFFKTQTATSLNSSRRLWADIPVVLLAHAQLPSLYPRCQGAAPMLVRGFILAGLAVNENRRAFRSSAGQFNPRQTTRTPFGNPARAARAHVAQAEHAGHDNASKRTWPRVAHGLAVSIVMTDSTDWVAVDTATRRLKTRRPRLPCKQRPARWNLGGLFTLGLWLKDTGQGAYPSTGQPSDPSRRSARS